MSCRPAVAAFVLACVPFATVAAQVPSPAAAAEATPFGLAKVLQKPAPQGAVKCWLWIAYDRANGALLDHLDHLEAMQRRLGPAGLAIGVVLHATEAADLAPIVARKPNLLLAVRDERPEVDVDLTGHHVVVTTGSEPVASFHDLDGVLDLVHACIEGEVVGEMAGPELLTMAGESVGDAELPAEVVEQLRERLPRSGTARAIAVLQAWWGEGDYDAATRAFDEGMKALAGEAVPMVAFADLVLRGEHADPAIAQRLATELAPIAAASPHGPRTQLVYLRALLRSRQDRVAGRLIAALPKRLAGQARLQVQFGETLMDAAEPAALRDVAMRAIDDAASAGWLAHQIVMARHKVLVRCGDTATAERLMKEFRDGGGGGDLNNDAWYTMVRLETMGRFDTYALAQCEELQRQEGEGISSGNQDTVALALFCNRRYTEAVALQKKAAAAAGQDPRYEARLRRFRAAAERARAKPAAPEPPKDPPK